MDAVRHRMFIEIKESVTTDAVGIACCFPYTLNMRNARQHLFNDLRGEGAQKMSIYTYFFVRYLL